MQLSTLGGFSSFTLQCGSGAAMVIWPDKTWIAVWVLIGSTITLILSIGWFIRCKWFPSIFIFSPNANTTAIVCSIYMKGSDAIHYVADKSAWGIKQRKQLQGREGFLLLFSAANDIRDACKDGKVRAMGRLGGTGKHIDIPISDWLTIQLEKNSFTRGQPISTTHAVPNAERVPYYSDVWFICDDIYRNWPNYHKKLPLLRGGLSKRIKGT